MIPTITTNLIIALAITTHSYIPIPCPDGLGGCLALHYTNHSSVAYTPLKSPLNEHFIAWDIKELYTCTTGTFGSIEWAPHIIPIVPMDFSSADSNSFPIGKHPIGFLSKELLIEANKKCSPSVDKPKLISTDNPHTLHGLLREDIKLYRLSNP